MIKITDEMILELSLSLDSSDVPQFTSFTGCFVFATSTLRYRPYFNYNGIGYAGVVWDGQSSLCKVFFRTSTTVIQRNISRHISQISFYQKIAILLDGSIELYRV